MLGQHIWQNGTVNESETKRWHPEIVVAHQHICRELLVRHTCDHPKKGDGCEGNTTTRPLLFSEILWKGKLIGHDTQLTSAVVIPSLSWNTVGTHRRTLPSTVVILRDQTEECPLCWVWSKHPQVELQTNDRTQMELAKWHKLGWTIDLRSEDIT